MSNYAVKKGWYMDRLSSSLDRDTSEIEAGLIEAHRERDLLRSRDRELTELIERAEVLLGHEGADQRRTLHAAITLVLEAQDDQWMHTRDIANEVNRRRLYRKRDGSPVEANQIHARAKNYAHLFEKDGPLVRLRTDAPPTVGAPLGSKYDPLRAHLSSTDADAVALTFEEIQDLIGSLPRSAWTHQAWWANERSGSHVQARSWLGAGFRLRRVDQERGLAWFERDQPDDGIAGVREPRRPRPSRPEDTIHNEIPESNQGDNINADKIWARIIQQSGEVFHQIKGKPFTYEARGRTIYLQTTNRMISRNAVERALQRVPLANTAAVQDLSAPSYVYAILMDDRIRGSDW